MPTTGDDGIELRPIADIQGSQIAQKVDKPAPKTLQGRNVTWRFERPTFEWFGNLSAWLKDAADKLFRSESAHMITPSVVMSPATSKLINAIKTGNLDEAKKAIDEGADVNHVDENGDTPLHHAARQGNVDVVKELLDHEADVNIADKNGNTPLHFAATLGNAGLMGLLLEQKDIKVDMVNRDGWTPLKFAARRGHVVVVNALLGRGADVNQADTNGQTPLFSAVSHGHAEVVKLLLKRDGIDVNSADKNGWTPLHLAADAGNVALVTALLGCRADVTKADVNGQTPLHCAAREGRAEVVDLLLQQGGVDVNKPDHRGWSPIELAVIQGRSEVVQKLIDKGGRVGGLKSFFMRFVTTKEQRANIDKVLHEIERRLLGACQEGNVVDVKAVIKAGADVNKKDETGSTLLCIAVQKGNIEIVRALIAGGADVNQGNSRNESPLYLAAYNGNRDLVLELLDAGAAVNQADVDGNTPLHAAAQRKDHGLVAALLDKGADKNKANKVGITPMAIAKNYQDGFVKVMLSGESKDMDDPLFDAISKGDLAAVQQAIKAKAKVDLNQKNASGSTLLCLAVKNGRVDIVTALIKAGADVNIPDTLGNTPLHLAARMDKGVELVQALFERGDAEFRKNNKGLSPLAIASKAKNPALLKTMGEQGMEVLQNKMKTTGMNAKDVEQLRFIAERGNAQAQYALGVCYEAGMGRVAKDAAEAAKWYRQASGLGYPQAQYALGDMYEHGKGVTKDVAEAVRLYRLAAAQEYSLAQAAINRLITK